MTTIEYSFSLGDLVMIKELKVNGYVIGLFTGQYGSEYEVAYFYDGDLKKEYLFETMLEMKNNSRSSFSPG